MILCSAQELNHYWEGRSFSALVLVCWTLEFSVQREFENRNHSIDFYIGTKSSSQSSENSLEIRWMRPNYITFAVFIHNSLFQILRRAEIFFFFPKLNRLWDFKWWSIRITNVSRDKCDAQFIWCDFNWALNWSDRIYCKKNWKVEKHSADIAFHDMNCECSSNRQITVRTYVRWFESSQ